MTQSPTRGRMIHPGAGDQATGETALYRLFNGTDQLLYVGISRNPIQRWGAHVDQHAWWASVVTYELEWFPTRAAAAAAEKTAIKSEAPMHNAHNTPRQGALISAGIAANAWLDGQSPWMRENRPASPDVTV